MSTKDHALPWRVLAIASVLLALVVVAAWLLFGSAGSGGAAPAVPDTAPAGTDAGGAPAGTEPGAATAAGAQAGTSATTTGTIDPTTPAGRAALAAARAASGTMDVQLFLIVPGLERLIPVARTVAAPATLDAQVRVAVEQLIAWAGSETVSPVPPQARVREVWISPGGIAYVDFDRAFYDFSGGGSLGELHTIYGIVATITESFPEIVAVQFLLEGERMDTLAGHIDLSRPLLPSSEWVLIEPGNSAPRDSNDLV